MYLRTYLSIVLTVFSSILMAQTKTEKIYSIDSIFTLLERNSTQLKLSESSIDLSHGIVSVVKNANLPSIDLSLSALYLGNGTILDRNFTNPLKTQIPHYGNNFSVEASYVVFAGGSINNSIEKAELEVQVAQLYHKKNISDMRFLVLGYYLDLCKLQNQKTVFHKNIEQTEVLIKHIAAKQKEGMVLETDLKRYELMLENLKLGIIEIENNIKILNQHLVITLGLEKETFILADSTIKNLKLSPISNGELMQIAEQNRPEISISKLKKNIANVNLKIERAKYYPSLAVIASDNLNGPITIEVPPFDKNFNYWYIGLALKYNLSSVYKTKQDVHLAKISKGMSDYAYELELENTQTSIYNAKTKYFESFEKLYTYEKTFQLACENYKIINNRYLNELVLITEMLDASNIKLNAELQVVNASLNIIYNHYKILLEIGKL